MATVIIMIIITMRTMYKASLEEVVFAVTETVIVDELAALYCKSPGHDA